MYFARICQEKAESLDKYLNYILCGFVFIACFAITIPALADQPAPPRSEEATAQLAEKVTRGEDLTRHAVSLAARYQQANDATRAVLYTKLETALLERQELLLELVDPAPGQVIRLALPAPLRARLPQELRSLVEVELEASGGLEVLYVDYEDASKSHIRYTLHTDLGERIRLHFAEKAPKAQSGTEVVAKGLYLQQEEGDGTIVASSGENGLELLACCDGATTASTASVTPVENTFGEQRTAVFLVNFQDDPDNRPTTLQAAYDMVFGSVSDFFLENSYQQTWLAGDAFGWYTLPAISTCSDTVIKSETDAMAAAQGVDLSSYERIVYIAPTVSCGGIAGQATVGGDPSRAYIYTFPNFRVMAHELGHNIGLFHSHGMNCEGRVVGSDCENIEYGDGLDVMGARPLHFNTFQKERLGWLNYGTSPSIATIEGNGTFQIPPVEFDGPGPQALKIYRDIDPRTGTARWLYLEYRQAVGFDEAMLGDTYLVTENVLNGVVFHLGTPGDTLYEQNSSYLLDLTPNSQINRLTDMDDPALVMGQTYQDQANGVVITTDWTDNTGATVSVDFGSTPSCVSADPDVSLSPSESQWVAPGTPVEFGVTITNNDNLNCDAASVDLISILPSGWIGNFTENALTLAPGASGSTTFSVTSVSSSADGFYDIVVTAQSSADTSRQGSDTTTYVVSAPSGNSPPVAGDDEATTSDAKAVVVAVLDNDYDPDNDQLEITGASNGSKGTVTVNGDGTVTYIPNPKAKGRDNFTYSVTDGASTVGAVVSVSVKKGGSGSKGGGKGKP